MRALRNLIQALRGLRTNRGNAALMMLGIIVGITSLTVIVAIGEGTKTQVMARITENGFGPDSFSVSAGAGRLFFSRTATPKTMLMRDVEDIGAIPTVRLVVPSQRKSVKVVYKNNFTETRVFGSTPEWQPALAWKLRSGTFFTDMDMERRRKVAVFGSTPAKKIFGDQDPVGKSVRLDQVYFEVIGVLDEKGVTESGHDPDDRIIIPLTTSASRLTHETHLGNIRVTTMTPELVNKTMEDVRQVLRRNHNLSFFVEDDFRFITPEGIMEWVTESKRAMNRMLVFISTISLLVGGIVIMNIMLVSVQDRIHEIGIRRCFGARRSDITQQFIFESVVVSVLGGILGVAIGFGISITLKKFDVLPTAITWEPFLIAFVLCALIGLVFGIQPARKAAFLTPEETLR